MVAVIESFGNFVAGETAKLFLILLCTSKMNCLFSLNDTYKLQLSRPLTLSITSVTAMTTKRNKKYKIVCDKVKKMSNINQQDIALLTCSCQNVDSTIDTVLNPKLYYYYNQVCIPLQTCDEINFYLTDEYGNRVYSSDEIIVSVYLALF